MGQAIRSSNILNNKVSLLQDINPFTFNFIKHKKNIAWLQEKMPILIRVRKIFYLQRKASDRLISLLSVFF